VTGYPDELPDEERAKCRVDEFAFGTSFVEMADDGPRRRDPTKVILSDE